MPYYHVIIYETPRQLSAEVLLDLSWDELNQIILQPGSLGNPITINGKTLRLEQIDRVRVSKADEASDGWRARAEFIQRTKWAGIILNRSQGETHISVG